MSSARDDRHRLVAARARARAASTIRSRVGCADSSMRPPSSTAASRSATLIGRSASGVCASPSSFSAPSRRSRPSASKAPITSARAQALALEQLADEPRARQLARDVVLQVRVQAAVARVELGRRAHREHRGLQQVQPERLDDGLQALVGVRRRLAVREPQRDLVGDVQAAERIARIGIRPGDALDRRHHAAVDEAEGDRRLRLRQLRRDLVGHVVRLALHGVARVRDGQRAARRRAALLDDVREFVRDQLVAVRSCWACTGPARSRRRCRSRTRARTPRD